MQAQGTTTRFICDLRIECHLLKDQDNIWYLVVKNPIPFTNYTQCFMVYKADEHGNPSEYVGVSESPTPEAIDSLIRWNR